MTAGQLYCVAGKASGGRGKDQSMCEGWRINRQKMFTQLVSGVPAIRIADIAFAAGVDELFRHLVAQQPGDRLLQWQQLNA